MDSRTFLIPLALPSPRTFSLTPLSLTPFSYSHLSSDSQPYSCHLPCFRRAIITPSSKTLRFFLVNYTHARTRRSPPRKHLPRHREEEAALNLGSVKISCEKIDRPREAACDNYLPATGSLFYYERPRENDRQKRGKTCSSPSFLPLAASGRFFLGMIQPRRHHLKLNKEASKYRTSLNLKLKLISRSLAGCRALRTLTLLLRILATVIASIFSFPITFALSRFVEEVQRFEGSNGGID